MTGNELLYNSRYNPLRMNERNLDMTEKIKEILAKQLRIDMDTIADDSNIVEDLGADSLDVVEMLMSIEDNLGIIISDDDAAKLKTVRDVADYLEANA